VHLRADVRRRSLLKRDPFVFGYGAEVDPLRRRVRGPA
jgi:hypothetical protein